MNLFHSDQDSPASSKSVVVCVFLTVVLLLALMAISQPIQAANSLSQNGITWTFDKDYQTGQFVNGEWWVIPNTPGGTVMITAISPNDPDFTNDIDIDGTCINPNKDLHGWGNKSTLGSSRGGVSRYQRDLNIARQLPYNVPVGSTVISTRGRPEDDTDQQPVESAAVLTVLAEAPPNGSFRPPYYGTWKPLFNESSLNYSVFQNLAPTPSAPTPDSLTNRWSKHMLFDLFSGGGAAQRWLKPSEINRDYGREIAKEHNRAVLTLNLNYTNAQKRNLLIEIVQRGIDIYGLVKGGYVYEPDGGHHQGRKITLFVAAKALGNADMLARCDTQAHSVFQEDLQHDFVRDTWPATYGTSTPPEATYGDPEWAQRAFTRLDSFPNPDMEASYRATNGCNSVGTVLAVELMNGRAAWNHEAFFRYVIERYWPYESQFPVANRPLDAAQGIPRFTYEMWNAYSKITGVPSLPEPPAEPATPTGVIVITN